MNLLVLGPQGSGKGTQAKRIAAERGIPHISTGDLFRDAISTGSELGVQVKAVLDDGGLVSDELTIALVENRLNRDDALDGFVLDGFPRTLRQATALDETLAQSGRGIDLALFFELADEIATGRMRERASVEGRPDDSDDAIARRLALYHEQTEPLVELYRARDLLAPLRAERSVDEVAAEIRDTLDRVGVGRR